MLDDLDDMLPHLPPAVRLPEIPDSYRDPSKMSFPPSLPVELAMREQPISKICEAYGITRESYEALCENPRFITALEEAILMLEKDGFNFRTKAALQAGDVIGDSYRMIKDPRTPAAVRADLIKATVAWSGLVPKEGTGPGAGGPNLNIQINLG